MRFSLDQYNKILVAVCGTGLLVLILAGAGGLVAELIPERHSGGIRTANDFDADRSPEPAAEPDFPEYLPGTDMRIIAMEVPSEYRGRLKFSGSGNERLRRNLIFQNTRTGDSHPLFTAPTLILRQEVLKESIGKDQERAQGLLLEIVDADSNKDGRIDASDESRLVFTDPAGAKVIPVSGPGVSRWEVAQGQKRVFFHASSEGRSVLMESALPPVQPATPVLAESTKAK